jgi:hypothetical protein
MKLEYDPARKTSYGMYKCPECGLSFQGGGPAVHNAGCSISGYEGVIYRFGPEQVKKVIAKAEFKQDEDSDYFGISLAMLREQFPQLLEQ